MKLSLKFYLYIFLVSTVVVRKSLWVFFTRKVFVSDWFCWGKYPWGRYLYFLFSFFLFLFFLIFYIRVGTIILFSFNLFVIVVKKQIEQEVASTSHPVTKIYHFFPKLRSVLLVNKVGALIPYIYSNTS